MYSSRYMTKLFFYIPCISKLTNVYLYVKTFIYKYKTTNISCEEGWMTHYTHTCLKGTSNYTHHHHLHILTNHSVYTVLWISLLAYFSSKNSSSNILCFPFLALKIIIIIIIIPSIFLYNNSLNDALCEALFVLFIIYSDKCQHRRLASENTGFRFVNIYSKH